MKVNLPLPQDKKLNVTFRVESGCLGPEGDSLIDEFCNFAQQEVETLNADFVNWEIVPRHDKSLPEMEYKISNKKLSHDKAERYLELFEKELNEFEEHLHEKIAILIDLHLGH